MNSSQPWLLDNFPRLNIIRHLEQGLPTIEQVGCKVGIGVATGLDAVYIGKDEVIDVEEEAQLPLVTTRDIVSGELHWGGSYVVNPFQDDGKLLDLNSHPRLQAYLERHKSSILKRNVAKKNPSRWYRTIDRINPALLRQPKLLIPDIKGEANVVYDSGNYYPHHNLYFITSEDWDIRALQAVLLSQVTQAFIATYSLRMRGDCLRYQAQYLRRVRLPEWKSVATKDRSRLIAAAEKRDLKACDLAAKALYGLSDTQWEVLISK